MGGLNGTGPGSGQNIDVNLMFQQKAQKMTGSSPSGVSNPGANILASLQSSSSLQSSYSNATQQGVANNQALPQRPKMQRPQRGPGSNVSNIELVRNKIMKDEMKI